MSNVAYVKQSNWNTQSAYEAINEEITPQWPEWKKRAYNEMFAVSTHAGKLEIKEIAR